jgi:hypothetical protein
MLAVMKEVNMETFSLDTMVGMGGSLMSGG